MRINSNKQVVSPPFYYQIGFHLLLKNKNQLGMMLHTYNPIYSIDWVQTYDKFEGNLSILVRPCLKILKQLGVCISATALAYYREALS